MCLIFIMLGFGFRSSVKDMLWYSGIVLRSTQIFENGAFPPEENYLTLDYYVDHTRQPLATTCLLLANEIKYTGDIPVA